MAKNNLSNNWSTGSSSLYKTQDTPSYSSNVNFGSNYSRPKDSYLSSSFDRMGLNSSYGGGGSKMGKIGGLGGRMGELEKASLRLGAVSSARQSALQRQKFQQESALQSKRDREERQQEAG